MSLLKSWVFFIFYVLTQILHLVAGTDCKTATVGSPFNDCFDIYTNASLTAAQFAADNPGLNCSLLQIGQKVCISSGTLPSNAPSPSPNGTCAEYVTVPMDTCSAIALKFTITVAEIETWNANTFKWNGCSKLQANFTMCVSSGTPPPIPIIPGLQCGPQSEGNATCPLNACCSAFGFCGLTSDFCTTSGPNPCISNCFIPSLPSCGTSRSMRNIGYYAGWGDRRACGTNVAPNEIDWSGYTHAHFAFATISQSLQIQIEDADAPLLKQLVAEKSNNAGLQVVIAVGGWDFSATFISSVVSFLSQYGLDGIDIDFEYPSAIERAAPPTDTPNLTSFFQELRTALPSKIISCATPAGYWFLKGFEIDKIAKSVTYLNMMSYDYHGPWDTNVTDQAPVTNPHTSILDMNDSALLYIRAGIDLSVVNLGLAYYARTYLVADPSCAGYNCTMTGGGAPGLCTATAGILAQFEVLDLLNGGITPTLDTTSETYWFDHEDSLVTFDQQDTWAIKQRFAGTSCFGGTFIWSLDQSTSNIGDGSDSGSSGGGQYTGITWNPNPFPSSGAQSETFAQSAGIVTSTFTTVVSVSSRTVTSTIIVPAATSTTTSWTAVSGSIGSTTGTTVIPASTTTVTRTVTAGSTITTTTVVTNTATTVVLAIPTTTTSITIGGVVITLNSGGTPVNSPVPTYISQPSAITPTWTLNILPPPSATSVTFTAPLTSTATWSSTVPVPLNTKSPAATVTGPPGDHTRCAPTINIWTLLFNALIGGCLPIDVGIRGGITPTPIKPPDWTGPWIDPFPLPTGPPGPGDGEPTNTNTNTETSTPTTSSECTAQTPVYDLPDDPENVDWDDLGTDPDTRRKREKKEAAGPSAHPLESRATGRHIAVNRCNIQVDSSSPVSLGAGPYVRLNAPLSTSTVLGSVQVAGRPGPNDQTPQEHVFELGYIDQFFTNSQMQTASCAWIQSNIFGYTRADGSNLGAALLAAIDTTQNMVWVDKAMNQAKSNVVNQNKNTPGDPPQYDSTVIIGDFNFDEDLIYNVERFLRNLAALGQYFGITSGIFQSTALRVQNLLSEVTPNLVPDPANSLPFIFNNWLNNLISTYPNGCQSRATNAWNFYRATMQSVAARSNPPVVPTCFRLYTANNYQPSGFNYLSLIPPVPTSAHCNVPGTVGNVGYTSGSTTVTQIPFLSTQVVMGSGNTDYYAMGSGTSLGGSHWQGVDAGAILPNCNGVFLLNDFQPTAGNPTANVAFQCNGGTGYRNAAFNFVINGQQLGCAVVLAGHPGGITTNIFCATSQGNALACAGSGATAVQMAFFPSS